jgi:hypothetical protein
MFTTSFEKIAKKNPLLKDVKHLIPLKSATDQQISSGKLYEHLGFKKKANANPVYLATGLLRKTPEEKKESKDLVSVQTKKNEDMNGFTRNIETRMGT